MLFFLRLLSAAALVLLAGCVTSGPSPAPVAAVDLTRYMGRWYVISHVPYFLERGKVASYDTYALRPDGRLTNNFTFREESLDGSEKTWQGVARVVAGTGNAKWKVSFLWPISVTYKIYLIDSDYQWAVVGNDDASLLWVLARERQIAPSRHESIERELRAKGIAIDKLTRVPQPAN